ncbi:carbohydrate porin [Roseateles sp. DXS20W]|uniref:Carbohydrate porin n=1 Tax=Pelomonas lactea TaxID=3299030 RepID=A0ABW7GPZ6_9BURK
MNKNLPTCLTLLGFALSSFAQDQEAWNAHFQSTYIWQKKPSLSSPYAGPNSLLAQAEKSYSFTATAAFGVRLSRLTEAYFDPEVAQGVPISGLVGLAGFSNGELAKTSGAKPKLYRARLFVRHTVDLGGEQQPIESAAHQLSGKAASERLVLSAGALSVLDIFDANSYAHDPRMQFMNWALMTHAAYDYPADSRGYTYGVAAEYIAEGWALRAGRFAVPKEPNQLQLDSRLFRHYGDQVELSKDYAVAGQTGTVRLLGFRMKAVMARYDDALSATSGTPTLDAVRQQDQAKWGVGIGVEHKLAENIGVFIRAFKADGRTETYAFTEADRSTSAGLQVGGSAWGRAQDVLGIGIAQSSLSTGHTQFLARGGQTFFLGDGKLSYRPERDFEAYYRAELLRGLFLTGDLQRIRNPGYNADRGPASFYALRLHWEN